jgi:hypothetical protein
MNSIQAIEVEYKGHRFRSKTEAKWAVFFDRIGIRWEYEPQGYTFENYSYLPDFYLPDRQMYVEIKPQDETVIKENTQRWLTFRKYIGKPLLVLAGHPWNYEFHAVYIFRDQDMYRSRGEYYAEMILFRGMLYFAVEVKSEVLAIPFLRTTMTKSQLEIAKKMTRQHRFTELW